VLKIPPPAPCARCPKKGVENFPLLLGTALLGTALLGTALSLASLLSHLSPPHPLGIRRKLPADMPGVVAAPAAAAAPGIGSMAFGIVRSMVMYYVITAVMKGVVNKPSSEPAYVDPAMVLDGDLVGGGGAGVLAGGGGFKP